MMHVAVTQNKKPHHSNDALNSNLGKLIDPDPPTARNIREEMRFFPNYLQPILTWVTGKPLEDEQPIIKLTPWLYLIFAIIAVAFPGIMTMYLLDLGGIWLCFVPLLWIIQVGGARTIQVTILHHCVHYNFSANKTIDRWIAEIASTILVIQDFSGYQFDHVSIHHSKKLATIEDPDLRFLITLGFLPSMSKKDLWINLYKTILSPRFHFLFFRARISANYKSSKGYRRMMFWVYLATLIIVIYWFSSPSGLIKFTFGWFIPLTIIYHIAALLQFVCEHKWLNVSDKKGRLKLARLTSGRFMGEAIPISSVDKTKQLYKWIKWGAKMLFIHIPFRIFVMVGDLPAHDWHHRHPKDHDWTIASYARQQDLNLGCPGWPEIYSEVWGLSNAIESVFNVLSSLDPINEDYDELTQEEKFDTIIGM